VLMLFILFSGGGGGARFLTEPGLSVSDSVTAAPEIRPYLGLLERQVEPPPFFFAALCCNTFLESVSVSD